jgi:kynureninase
MQMTTSKEFAQKLDSEDTLAKYRGQFFIPPGKTRAEQLYFTGNSLGLQPKSVVDYIQQELNDWQKLGVEGHFHGKNPWFSYHHFFDKKQNL